MHPGAIFDTFLDAAQNLSGERSSFAFTEENVFEHIKQRTAFGPAEINVRVEAAHEKR